MACVWNVAGYPRTRTNASCGAICEPAAYARRNALVPSSIGTKLALRLAGVYFRCPLRISEKAFVLTCCSSSLWASESGANRFPPLATMTTYPRRPRVVRRPRGLASHVVILTGVSIAAIAACAKVGEDVFNHETEPFDEPIRDWVLAHQSRVAERVFLFATHAGSPRVIIPCTGAAAAWLWRRKGLPIAGAVVLAPRRRSFSHSSACTREPDPLAARECTS